MAGKCQVGHGLGVPVQREGGGPGEPDSCGGAVSGGRKGGGVIGLTHMGP